MFIFRSFCSDRVDTIVQVMRVHIFSIVLYCCCSVISCCKQVIFLFLSEQLMLLFLVSDWSAQNHMTQYWALIGWNCSSCWWWKLIICDVNDALFTLQSVISSSFLHTLTPLCGRRGGCFTTTMNGRYNHVLRPFYQHWIIIIYKHEFLNTTQQKSFNFCFLLSCIYTFEGNLKLHKLLASKALACKERIAFRSLWRQLQSCFSLHSQLDDISNFKVRLVRTWVLWVLCVIVVFNTIHLLPGDNVSELWRMRITGRQTLLMLRKYFTAQ